MQIIRREHSVLFNPQQLRNFRTRLRARAWVRAASRSFCEENRRLAAENQAYQRMVDRLAGDEAGKKMASVALYLQILETPVQRRPVSVSQVVHQLLGEFAWEHAERSVEVRQSALPECCADPVLLRQVYRILLSNAFKFTRSRSGARIEVGHLKRGRDLVWYVRDNGAGFAAREKHLLFQPFRGPRCVRDLRGAGVGLATARRIIEGHGGRIWAEGQENRGAAFFFTLGGGKE